MNSSQKTSNRRPVRMWRYQSSFRREARLVAENLFGRLDPQLHPNVFLLGIPIIPGSSRGICIEPEDCGYPPEIFSRIHALVNQILKTFPEDEDLDLEAGVTVQKNIESMVRMALRYAIVETLAEADEEDLYHTYASHPEMVKDYYVSVVLQLRRDVVNRHPDIPKELISTSDLASSLIESAVFQYLEACAGSLNVRDVGFVNTLAEREIDELMRRAGVFLMRTPARLLNRADSLSRLYDDLNIISALHYEGAAAKGRMAFVQQESEKLDLVLTFESPIPLSKHRAVRKLLELSSGDICLVSNTDSVFGLCRFRDILESEAAIFHIEFNKHFHWKLHYADRMLMEAIYETPSLPRYIQDEERLRATVQQIFQDIEKQQIDRLWNFSRICVQQHKGTILIVSAAAKEEAHRLRNQAIPIKPKILTNSLLHHISSIDGAVLIDPDGICYAIGVILDGVASEGGDPARGSRYNSAIRYVDCQNVPCMAIIVSSDGMLNLVPEYLPMISGTMVPQLISELEEISRDSKVNVNIYYYILHKIRQNQTYLSEEDCVRINSVFQRLGNRIVAGNGMPMDINLPIVTPTGEKDQTGEYRRK